MSVSLSAQQAVTPMAFSEARETVRAFSDFGETALSSLRVQVEVPVDGKKELGSVLVVYDPQSGRYLWRYRKLESPESADTFVIRLATQEAIYIDAGRLISFSEVGGLTVTEYTERTSSLDAARTAAFNYIQLGHPVLGKSGIKAVPRPDPTKLTSARPAVISREFYCDPNRADCPGAFQTTIVSVAKQGSNWRLVLRNRWDQEYILDSKFAFVSTRQLTPSPPR